jgi:hypothetical protein
MKNVKLKDGEINIILKALIAHKAMLEENREEIGRAFIESDNLQSEKLRQGDIYFYNLEIEFVNEITKKLKGGK